MRNFIVAARAYHSACGDYYFGASKTSRQLMIDTLKPLVAAIQALDLNDPESSKALQEFKNNQQYIKNDNERCVRQGEVLVIPKEIGVLREVDLIKISSKVIEIIEAKQIAYSVQTTTPPNDGYGDKGFRRATPAAPKSIKPEKRTAARRLKPEDSHGRG